MSTQAAAATAACAAAVAAGDTATLPILSPPPPAIPNLPSGPTTTMVALATRAPVRLAVVQSGRWQSEGRPVNLEALLGQNVGQVNASGCSYCKRGFGVWSACVSVPGFFGGSCANCHYNCHGARCSLRPAPSAPPAPPPVCVIAAGPADRARAHQVLADLYRDDAEKLEEEERALWKLPSEEDKEDKEENKEDNIEEDKGEEEREISESSIEL